MNKTQKSLYFIMALVVLLVSMSCINATDVGNDTSVVKTTDASTDMITSNEK